MAGRDSRRRDRREYKKPTLKKQRRLADVAEGTNIVVTSGKA